MFVKNNAIIGLDVGIKRIGVAVLSPGQVVPSPSRTLKRGGHQAEKELINLIDKISCKLIVVGLPLDEDGLETAECQQIRAFCDRLTKRVNIKIEFFDESFSSFEAKDRLGLSKSPDKKVRQKGMIDAVSASIILERYLEFERIQS